MGTTRRALALALIVASHALGCAGATEMSDGGLDAAAEAALDAGSDTGGDAGRDAGSDAGTDVGIDASGCRSGVRCDGVCVELASDIHHCGDCAVDCAAWPGVDATRVACSGGVCDLSLACVPGRLDCDGDPSTGCETDSTDAAHCGACDVVCASAPHAAPTCASGACGLACDPGFDDCDLDPSNGCETPLTTALDCGACGLTCTNPTALCGDDGGGAFACVPGCVGATPSLCASSCVDLTSDPSHCGDCDRACPAPANGAPACELGSCTVACDAGFHACAGACLDDAAPTSCGSLCSPCPSVVGASPTCDGSACGFSCDPGRADCEGSAADGCETLLATSAAHCGACGHACASGLCEASACVPRGTSGNPGTSCADVLAREPGATTGTYWISPDGGAAVQVPCEMTIDGGGWTQLTDALAARWPAGTRTYLYLYGVRWYQSPATSLVWNWSAGQEQTGTYRWFDGTTTGSTSCTGSLIEQPSWGVGCSSGPGRTAKVLPYYAQSPSTAQTMICQDVPNAYGVPACTPPNAVTIFVR